MGDLKTFSVAKEVTMMIETGTTDPQVTLPRAICVPPINGYPQFFCCWHSANVSEGAASSKA